MLSRPLRSGWLVSSISSVLLSHLTPVSLPSSAEGRKPDPTYVLLLCDDRASANDPSGEQHRRVTGPDPSRSTIYTTPPASLQLEKPLARQRLDAELRKRFRAPQSPKEGSRLLAAFTAYLFKHHRHVWTTEVQLPSADTLGNGQDISPAQKNEHATPIQDESRNITTTTAEEPSSEDVITAVGSQLDLPTHSLVPDATADQGVDTTSPPPNDEEAQQRKTKTKTTSSPPRLRVITAWDKDSAPPASPPPVNVGLELEVESEEEEEGEEEEEESSTADSSAAVSATGTAPTSPGDSPKIGTIVCAGFEVQVLGSLDESEAANDAAVETETRASPYTDAAAYADADTDSVADNGLISASSVYDPDFNLHIVANDEIHGNTTITWIEPTVRRKSEKQIVRERMMFYASSSADYHQASSVNTTTTTLSSPAPLLGLNSGEEEGEEMFHTTTYDDNELDNTESENKKTASTV